MARKNDRERQELSKAIEYMLSIAEGGRSDEGHQARRAAMKAYMAMPRGDEKEGCSDVIATDIRDMVTATLAMLTPMLSVDSVGEFEPLSEDDEAQAAMESYYINKVIMEQNKGYMQIQEAVKDGLLLRNGAFHIYTEDTEESRTMDVSGLDNAQVAAQMAQIEDQEGIADVWLEDNRIVYMEEVRNHRLRARPIERICYTANWTRPFQDLPFFADQDDITRSELFEMGLDKDLVKSLASEFNTNEVDQLRNRSFERIQEQAGDKSTEIISCWWVYVKVDLDGDGIAERYRVLAANRNEVLSWERFDVIPYAVGSPFIFGHRITGESLYDHLYATQDAKTTLKRQFDDNVQTVLNGRYNYNPSTVNEKDVLNPVAGGGVRSSKPGQDVVPLIVPDVTPGILSALEYEDRVRAERGGASLDLMSADAQLVGETAHGIERQIANREALSSMMATNFAESMIRDAWLLMHRQVRLYSNGPVMVKYAGKYVQIDPRTWPERSHVNIDIGESPGKRASIANALQQSLSLQVQAMVSGASGVLADYGTIYRTHTDWLRRIGIPNPDRYGINPDSEAAVAAQQQAAQQAEQARARSDAQVKATLDIERQKILADARKANADRTRDYYKINVDQETRIGEAQAAHAQAVQQAEQAERAAAMNGASNGNDSRQSQNGTGKGTE